MLLEITKPKPARRTKRRRALKEMKAAVASGPLTAGAIAMKLGVTNKWVDQRLGATRARVGTRHFYIAGWRREPGRTGAAAVVALYAAGPGEDVERPARPTPEPTVPKRKPAPRSKSKRKTPETMRLEAEAIKTARDAASIAGPFGQLLTLANRPR